MILVQFLAATAMLAGAAQGQPAAGAPAPGPGYTEITKSDAQTMIAKCGARKFETYADEPHNGKIRRQKLTLCAPDSDSDAAWIATLEKAAATIEANAAIPPPAKRKLLGDFRTEIARLKALPSTPEARKAVPAPAPQGQLPLAQPIAPVAAAPPRPAAIPPYVPSPTQAGGLRLMLSAACVPPGESKSAPCGVMAPTERLEIRANSDIGSPVTLVFRRTGKGMFGGSEKEAEVELASGGMRRGETVRLRVPRKICSGFRTSFEVEVRTKDSARNKQGPSILGPFETRCDT